MDKLSSLVNFASESVNKDEQQTFNENLGSSSRAESDRSFTIQPLFSPAKTTIIIIQIRSSLGEAKLDQGRKLICERNTV
jgi:hypothetical protein